MHPPMVPGDARGGGFRDAGALGATSTGIGAALTTVAASACCLSPTIAPVVVGLLGASGAAWAAGLKPYSGYILAGSFVLIAASYWTVFRPQAACVIDENTPRTVVWRQRIVKGVLWLGGVLWTTSLILHLVLPK